jgi:hypothetical protein
MSKTLKFFFLVTIFLNIPACINTVSGTNEVETPSATKNEIHNSSPNDTQAGFEERETLSHSSLAGVFPLADCNFLGIDECIDITIQDIETWVQTIDEDKKREDVEIFVSQMIQTLLSRVEFEKANGQIELNPDGKEVFMGLSKVMFDDSRANFSLMVLSEIKWWNIAERSYEERAAAVQEVQQFANEDEFEYLGTSLFVMNPLIRIEQYQSRNYLISVNVENNQIISIDPLENNAVCGYEFNRDELLDKALGYAESLAPTIDLSKYEFIEESGCTSFYWLDNGTALLQNSFGTLYIELTISGGLQRFYNSMVGN